MSDYYEIDFLNVESKRSGDAIPLRYRINEVSRIHVVDGGFQATGDKLIEHINRYYGHPTHIDHVVATHPDGDHAGGLRSLFDEYTIGALWMLRPWLYANELIHRFARFQYVANLEQRLRELYPNLDVLEQLAFETGTPIYEPFQGARIGAFYVLAPTKARFLDMVVDSERTPELSRLERENLEITEGLLGLLRAAVEFVAAKWGDERFSDEETSAENEMSVVQYAYIDEKRILLTADAGRSGLTEAANYLEAAGVALPGLDVFQVPHHGSRRNVSTALLDRWLGRRLLFAPGEPSFTAAISASAEDTDHPRKAVVRACYHRGAGSRTVSSEHGDLCIGSNSPHNRGWVAATALPYPDQQED
ncbi:MAG: MBL fold metallo-hydrolase [Proteobacteria bacterium]|nr:MBL fold metallo-hydrolase [Pseudomonadota bacterium]